MTEATNGSTLPKSAAQDGGASDLYRAVWRWHFYAGLLILPFLITMAVSGVIYLFRDEIDIRVHADFMQVTPAEEQRLHRQKSSLPLWRHNPERR